MRFLADENFPLDAIESLKNDGHDVASIRADSPGIGDEFVLGRAVLEQRVLLTFDKDFGDLAFHAKFPASCGIIFFRIQAPSSAALSALVCQALSNRIDWSGQFSVIEPTRIRIKPLPTP